MPDTFADSKEAAIAVVQAWEGSTAEEKDWYIQAILRLDMNLQPEPHEQIAGVRGKWLIGISYQSMKGWANVNDRCVSEFSSREKRVVSLTRVFTV